MIAKADSIDVIHENCVMCGSNNPLSLGLEFSENESGDFIGHFYSRKDYQGYDGVVHGGVVSALLDSAMTNYLFKRGVKAVTGDLYVRYKKPVPCEVDLIIRADEVSSNPPLYKMKAELIYREKVYARAEARFMQVNDR